MFGVFLIAVLLFVTVWGIILALVEYFGVSITKSDTTGKVLREFYDDKTGTVISVWVDQCDPNLERLQDGRCVFKCLDNGCVAQNGDCVLPTADNRSVVRCIDDYNLLQPQMTSDDPVTTTCPSGQVKNYYYIPLYTPTDINNDGVINTSDTHTNGYYKGAECVTPINLNNTTVSQNLASGVLVNSTTTSGTTTSGTTTATTGAVTQNLTNGTVTTTY